MTPTLTNAVTISPEAEQLAAELGMRSEMDLMIEHACQTIPGLERMEVAVVPPCDMDEQDHIMLYAYRGVEQQDASDWTGSEFHRWEIETFPPAVCVKFTLMDLYWSQDGG